MKKEFRVNTFCPGRPQCLVLLLSAESLDSAIKILRCSSEFQLPTAQYYVYEAGNHANGISIALTPAFVGYFPISQEEAETVSGYLHAKTKEQFQNEDNTISHTVVFSDGKQMDIKCCGAQDECSWTEAVLFDENGYELCCSEVSEHYVGTWELEYKGRRYVVIVCISNNM